MVRDSYEGIRTCDLRVSVLIRSYSFVQEIKAAANHHHLNVIYMLKKMIPTHIEHQQLPQKTEYSPGSSAEPNKTRGKPETIHSPTNATKQHNKYSDQGYSIPETSL